MNIIYGRKPLLDNLNNSKFIKVDLSQNNRDLIPLLQKRNIPFKVQENSFFNKLNSKLNHQGVVSYLQSNQNTINTIEKLLSNNKNSHSIILVIDSIQDPQNFGSILRTANAMSVDAIIYKKDNQVQINDLVIKTSMGAFQHLNLIKVNNLSNALSQLKEARYWIYVSSLDAKSVEYTKTKYDSKTVIVVGNEDKGVSKLICNNADFLIKIPMLGTTQSLNVAVATGILLSEVNRQLR